MSAQHGEADLSGHGQPLVSALQALHLQAGKPSARTIAKSIGSVSHTTVAEALSGRRIPSWPIVRSIVQYLSGDEDEYRVLWAATTSDPSGSSIDSPIERDYFIRYRQQVAMFYGMLRVPDFDLRRGAPIDELYVTPTVVAEQPDVGHDVDLASVMDEFDRVVLLGGPGSGKTCACQALMYRQAAAESSLVPFLVPLREFATGSGKTQSVLGFLEHQLATIFQYPAPEDALPHLMRRGAALVIFDGLDEVPDKASRADIASTIELFCAEFPRLRVLVTSRTASYDAAQLEPRTFTTYRLEEFDDLQVNKYVNRWFAQVEEDFPGHDASSLAEAFMAETAQMTDLRATPLHLALMCAAYQGQGSILRNLPEFYEKCIDVTFSRRDIGRRVGAGLRAQYLVVPLLRRLAFWMLIERGAQPLISERELTALATEYLHSRLEILEDAEDAVRELLTFFQDRASVLYMVGVAPDGERQYAFAHRGFLEYFGASQLVARVDTPEQLAHQLAPRLAAQQWMIVGQVAILVVDRTIERGAERVVQGLLGELNDLPLEQRGDLLNFLVQCLDLVYLPSTLVRTLNNLSAERGAGIGVATSSDTLFPVDHRIDDLVGYRGIAACQLAGLTYRQLDYWSRTGLITPSIRGERGLGGQRLYSFKDIVLLKTAKQLLDTGVSMHNIRQAVDHLHRRDVQDLARITLFSDGETVYETTSPEEVFDLLQRGQGVFGVSVGSSLREISALIHEFPAERAAGAPVEMAGDVLTDEYGKSSASTRN